MSYKKPRREGVIIFAVSDAEKSKIRQASERIGMDMSTFVRSRTLSSILSDQIKIKSREEMSD